MVNKVETILENEMETTHWGYIVVSIFFSIIPILPLCNPYVTPTYTLYYPTSTAINPSSD